MSGYSVNSNNAVEGSHFIGLEIGIAGINAPGIIDVIFILVSPWSQHHGALKNTVTFFVRELLLTAVPIIKIASQAHRAAGFGLHFKDDPFAPCGRSALYYFFVGHFRLLLLCCMLNRITYTMRELPSNFITLYYIMPV